MTETLDQVTDPTELGPAREPRDTPASSVEARVAALAKLTPAEVVAVANRVQRSRNPLHAATLVSAREILAMTELILLADAAAARGLPPEEPAAAGDTDTETDDDNGDTP